MTDRDNKGRFSKARIEDDAEEGFWEKPPSTKFFIIALLILIVLFAFPHEHARKRTCLSLCFPDDFGGSAGHGNSSFPPNSPRSGLSGTSSSATPDPSKNRTGI